MISRGWRWIALVDKVQRLWRDSRRGSRPRRVRLTWQTCRRCGSSSFIPVSHDRLCGGCRSLQ